MVSPPALLNVNACISAKGWDVKVTPPNFNLRTDGMSSAETKRLTDDYSECSWEYVVTPLHFEMVDQYEKYLDQRECLIAEGYSVSEPPSKAVWVESVQRMQNPDIKTTADDGAWQPLYEVELQIRTNLTEQTRLHQACPNPTGGLSL